MKFSIPYKIFSVALSILVLFSTVSLTIEKHFCGGTLIDVAVFSKIEKCASDSVTDVNTTDSVKKSCCKDEVDVIEGIDQLTTNSFEDLDGVQQHVLFAYSYSYLRLLAYLPSSASLINDYIPPLLVRDIHVLDETYLI